MFPFFIPIWNTIFTSSPPNYNSNRTEYRYEEDHKMKDMVQKMFDAVCEYFGMVPLHSIDLAHLKDMANTVKEHLPPEKQDDLKFLEKLVERIEQGEKLYTGYSF